MNEQIILREDAASLINEEQAKDIIQGSIAKSVVFSKFKRLPNMASNKLRMPVLDLLPMAGFVNGDTGLKPVTKMKWNNKYIHAEEIAVIVPIPDAVLDDAKNNGYDIYEEIAPRVEEAFGKVLDGAALFSLDKPSTWEDGLVNAAIKTGNVVTSTGDIYADVYGEDGVIAKVEGNGFDPNGVVASVNLKGKLRGLKDANGRPLYLQDLRNGEKNYSIDGMDTTFLKNGAFDVEKATMIVGDFDEAVFSIRQDLTVKVLTESVITDADGKVLINLAQQDMTALRFVMRLGWATANGINALNPNDETRYPFAVYAPATSAASAKNTSAQEIPSV